MKKIFSSLMKMRGSTANGNGHKPKRSQGYEIWTQMGFSPVCELDSAIEEYKREFSEMMLEGKRWMQKARTPEDCAIRIPRTMQPRRPPAPVVATVIVAFNKPVVRATTPPSNPQLRLDQLITAFAAHRLA